MADDNDDECPASGKTLTPPHESHSAIGYRRPPRDTQFQPGRSGNPKGRPRGLRNAKTEIADILGQPIKVREGNRICRTTKFGAMTLAHVQNGMKGDVRSYNAVTSVMARTGLLNAADAEGDTKPLSAEDEAIIRDFLARSNGGDPV